MCLVSRQARLHAKTCCLTKQQRTSYICVSRCDLPAAAALRPEAPQALPCRRNKQIVRLGSAKTGRAASQRRQQQKICAAKPSAEEVWASGYTVARQEARCSAIPFPCRAISIRWGSIRRRLPGLRKPRILLLLPLLSGCAVTIPLLRSHSFPTTQQHTRPFLVCCLFPASAVFQTLQVPPTLSSSATTSFRCANAASMQSLSVCCQVRNRCKRSNQLKTCR